MLSFLKTALFRDSVIPNPFYTTRECYHSSWFGQLLQTRKAESCTTMAADTHSSSLESVRERELREVSLLVKRETHTRVKKSVLQSVTSCGRNLERQFHYHRTQKDSPFLMVGGILKLFSLTSCLTKPVPHIRQSAEGKGLGVSSGYKVHKIRSPL